jgi:hypothetical protein
VSSTTWHGRRGPVILGPTEHRVAAWLRDRTRFGRVTIATMDLARELRLERSEAYRITARLRVLGLFGVENDQGGARGGRRWWRTAIEHDGSASGLDPVRHRQAWARIVAWARARKTRLSARFATLHTARPSGSHTGGAPTSAPDELHGPPGAGVTFAESMRRAGLGALMDAWGVD